MVLMLGLIPGQPWLYAKSGFLTITFEPDMLNGQSKALKFLIIA